MRPRNSAGGTDAVTTTCPPSCSTASNVWINSTWAAGSLGQAAHSSKTSRLAVRYRAAKIDHRLGFDGVGQFAGEIDRRGIDHRLSGEAVRQAAASPRARCDLPVPLGPWRTSGL